MHTVSVRMEDSDACEGLRLPKLHSVHSVVLATAVSHRYLKRADFNFPLQ